MNPRPGDKPAVSEEERAQWELEVKAGRLPYYEQPPSRSRFGRLLDALERMVNASSGRGFAVARKPLNSGQ